jgi:hypothetical protein
MLQSHSKFSVIPFAGSIIEGTAGKSLNDLKTRGSPFRSILDSALTSEIRTTETGRAFYNKLL